VGALALGIVKGSEWGWDSARVLGSLGLAVVLLPALLWRSAGHRAPVIDLTLFRTRSFAVANAGMFVFSAAFYALLLAGVLFLTQVWGYSILEAGFAITPGPLMAALAAPPGGRLSDLYGQRVVAVPGALLFAAGAGLLALNMDSTPDYVAEYLPAQMLTGAGVGLSFAAWGSAAVAQLPPARFATGSAVLACVRQIGAVVGIAVLVAVLDGAAADDPAAGFKDAWTLMAFGGLATAAIGVALGRVRASASAGATAEAAA
jgi:MFS family permease